MKINIFKYFFLFLGFFISLIFYLSIVGIETDKFNQQIKDTVVQSNNNLDVSLKKVKLILDPLKLRINAKTIGANIYYACLLYTSPSPRDISGSRMPSSA